MKKYDHIKAPYSFKEFYSKYPQGYTIFEALLDWLDHVNSMTDQMNVTVDEWLNLKTFVNEELKNYSIEQLEAWLDDGTLEQLINDTLFNTKLDVSAFETFKTSLQTQLGDLGEQMTSKANLSALNLTNQILGTKASQSDVNELIEDVSKRPTKEYVDNLIQSGDTVKGVYSTLSALENAYPTGTTGIFIVTENGNWYYWDTNVWVSGGIFQSTQLADNSIEPIKIQGAKRSGNLFELSKATNGSYWYNNNGVLTQTPNPNYYYEYIKVEPNTEYSMTFGRFVIELSGGTMVDDHENITTLITGPTTDEIIINFSGLTYNPNTFMFVEGLLPLEYIGPKYSFNWLLFDERIEKTLLIPNVIFGVENVELNIQKENINSGKYVKLIGDGLVKNDMIVFENSTSGTKNFTIDSFENYEKKVDSKKVQLLVAPKSAGTGATKRVLLIGDSTIASNGGRLSTELLNLFSDDPMSIELLGTRGIAPARHEGRAGWTLSNQTGPSEYEGVLNPFYNTLTEQFDFARYMMNQGYTGVDYVLIQSGINEAYLPKNQSGLVDYMDIHFERLQIMIDSIRSYDINIKIGLSIPTIHNTQDVFSLVYGNDQFEFVFRHNLNYYRERLIKTYENDPTVKIVSNHLEFVQSTDLTDAVHPNLTGYKKIAKSIFAWIKALV